MDRKKFQRKRYIIEKEFQIKYIGILLFTNVLFALIVGWTVYSNIWSVLVNEGNPYLISVMRYTDFLLLCRLILLMLAVGLISVLISHKFAGPIYRLKMAFRDVGKGKLDSKIVLRKGDQLTDLVDSFNEMIKNLGELVDEDRDLAEEIVKRLDSIIARIDSGDVDSQELAIIMLELKNINKEAENITSKFKM